MSKNFVITISYGKNLFEEGNPERERMRACAHTAGEIHMVVLTNVQDNLKEEIVDGVLYLHPTQAKGKFSKVFRAIRIGLGIVRSKKEQWIISAQDPFEAGFIGFVIARLARVPLNIQEHGDFFSTQFWRREKWGNRIRYFVGLFLLRRADSVRVVTPRIRQTLIERGVHAHHISVLPVMVRVEDFLSGQPSSREDEIHILCAGRFVKQKNIPLLIHAFKRVYEQDSRTRLVLVGQGGEESVLRALIKELGIEACVSIQGWSKNLPALMGTAHIYALSSNYEGYGRVILEAMASGLPVVSTDVGCVGTVLLDQEQGIVVPVSHEEAFAQALLTLVKDPILRKKYGDAGKLTAQHLKETSGTYAAAWVAALTPTAHN